MKVENLTQMLDFRAFSLSPGMNPDKNGQSCFIDPQHPTIPSDEGCPFLSSMSETPFSLPDKSEVSDNLRSEGV